jgi:hypothetical protein
MLLLVAFAAICAATIGAHQQITAYRDRWERDARIDKINDFLMGREGWYWGFDYTPTAQDIAELKEELKAELERLKSEATEE